MTAMHNDHPLIKRRSPPPHHHFQQIFRASSLTFVCSFIHCPLWCHSLHISRVFLWLVMGAMVYFPGYLVQQSATKSWAAV